MILAGDITGKTIVPIMDEGNGTWIGHTRQVFDEEVKAKNRSELDELVQKIRNAGGYPYETDEIRFHELESDPAKLRRLFMELMLETVERWMRMAEDRLRAKDVQFFVMPGNDDASEVSEAIRTSNLVKNPEGLVVELDGDHAMISLGYSNPTPWKTPREVDEGKLAEMIEAMAARLRDPKNSVFNLHCPPYDSGLDVAPQLDENLRPIVTMGDLVRVPVGSTAVRTSIERYQPLVGLHGHIHESAGQTRIGRTICLNPGSEYQYGILRGYLLDLEKDKVRQCIRVEA
jgi:hypothetical protein